MYVHPMYGSHWGRLQHGRIRESTSWVVDNSIPHKNRDAVRLPLALRIPMLLVSFFKFSVYIELWLCDPPKAEKSTLLAVLVVSLEIFLLPRVCDHSPGLQRMWYNTYKDAGVWFDPATVVDLIVLDDSIWWLSGWIISLTLKANDHNIVHFLHKWHSMQSFTIPRSYIAE